MPASVFTLDPAACLMSNLIDDLAARSPAELRESLLLLPTQRLGTFVLAGLLKKHGALIPPRIMTLENLLQQQAPTDRRLIGDSGVDLLLGRLIAEGHYTHLRPGHERELRLLHGELFDHGIRDEALDRLKTAIRDDIYKSEIHLGSLYDRAVEIEHVLNLLDLVLDDRGLRTRSAHIARSAQLLAQRWPDKPVPAQHFVLAGYTSLASSWQILLDTWLQDDRFAFWFSEAPALYHASSPLKELLQKIAGTVTPTRRQLAPRPLSQHTAARATSFVEESQWALRGAVQLIEQGFSPEKIGILVTDEKRYAVPLEQHLHALGLEANLALARPWASSLPGRCLSAIEQLWTERESMPTLLACLDQPLVSLYLSSSLGWGEEADFQHAALKEALLHSGLPNSLDRAIHTLREPWRSVLVAFKQLLAPLHPQQLQSLSRWTEALATWATTIGLWDAPEDRDLLQSCRESFDHFLETLQLLGDAGQPIDGRTFWQLCKRHLLETDIRRTGEPLAGLQILILSEARYFPFQAVFLLGCQEGSFPKGLPQDELLDNYLKKAMGLPGWEILEAMEDQTFHLLKARVPFVSFLRSERCGEEALVRSRFVESLIVKAGLQEEILPASPRAEWPLDAALDLALEPEGKLAELSLRSPMSASRLERLLRCPYAFLLDRLGVRGLEPPPPWGDSRREGEWLHSILEALVTGRRGMHVYIEPWKPQPGSDLAAEALQRLETLTAMLAPPELQESALMQHLQEHSWPRFASHLAQLYGAAPEALQDSVREYNFQARARRRPLIEVAERPRELVGRIDAIDPQPQLVTVTDYKRRTTPSGKETREGVAPQLGFYALALEQLEPKWEQRGLLFGYWNIYKGEWEPQAVSAHARELALRQGLVKRDTSDLDELKQSLLQAWGWREQDIDELSRYYADPGQCQLCSYAGICRKVDPRAHATLLEQQRLRHAKREEHDS